MICKAKTEQEMRDVKDPVPNTIKELSEYIKDLSNRNHDYGTYVYAMSLSAVAAYNFIAHKLGVTGFQAAYADLDIIRRNRGINGSFIILKGEDLLYPQYDLRHQLDEWINEQKEWLKLEATKKIEESKGHDIHPDVMAHWTELSK